MYSSHEVRVTVLRKSKSSLSWSNHKNVHCIIGIRDYKIVAPHLQFGQPAKPRADESVKKLSSLGP